MHIFLKFVLLIMLSILLFAFIFLLLLFYSKIGLSLYTTELDCLAIPHNYYLTVSGCVGFWRLNPQLIIRIVIPSILFIARSGFVHSVFSYTRYLKFQTGQHLILCLLMLKFPRSFLYYIWWKFLLLCWHYALCFPAPIMLKILLHNQLKPTSHW